MEKKNEMNEINLKNENTSMKPRSNINIWIILKQISIIKTEIWEDKSESET